MRVLVAGGGIFGVTAALAFRARGFEVTVVEPGPVPPEAAVIEHRSGFQVGDARFQVK